MTDAKMLYVGGSKTSFRCECGCNIFHSFKVRKGLHREERYECNACGQVYAGGQEESDQRGADR